MKLPASIPSIPGTTTGTPSQEGLFLASCSLFAFALSMGLLSFSYFIGHDGVWYARMAENIWKGNGVCVNVGQPYIDHPPFYPLLIGLANFLTGDLEFSGHLVSSLTFALSVIPLFGLAKNIYGIETARWASLLFATNGFLLLHSHLVLPESTFLLLVLAQYYLVHKWLLGPTSSYLPALIVGLLAGIAYLTRPEALFFYLAGIVVFLFQVSHASPGKWRMLGVSAAVFLIFFLTYGSFVYGQTGRFQLSGAVTEIFIKRQLDVSHPGQYLEAKKIFEGLTEDKTRLEMDELKEHFGLAHYFFKDRGALLRSGVESAVWRLMTLNKYLFGGLGFFLIGASFFHRPWNQSRKKGEALLLAYLATILPQLFGIFHPKRFFLYLPVFLIWTGNGVGVFRDWAAESFGWKGRKLAVASLGIGLLLIVPSGWYVMRTLKYDRPALAYKTLGLWMKNHVPDIVNEKVASRHPSVIFYSGAKLMNPPYLPYVENLEDFKTYMKHQGAKYFVMGEDLELPALTSYRFLLDEAEPLPPGITLKQKVREKMEVALFEIAF